MIIPVTLDADWPASVLPPLVGGWYGFSRVDGYIAHCAWSIQASTLIGGEARRLFAKRSRNG
jgi:hypothetical protein